MFNLLMLGSPFFFFWGGGGGFPHCGAWFQASVRIFLNCYGLSSLLQVTLYHLLKLFQTESALASGKKQLVSEFYDEIVSPDHFKIKIINHQTQLIQTLRGPLKVSVLKVPISTYKFSKLISIHFLEKLVERIW